MRLVFLGENDWANSCNRIARAINHMGRGMTARAVTVKAHKFGYEEDIVIERDGYAAAHEPVREADWLISSGDGKYNVLQELLNRFAVNPARVRLATMHAGTAYRNDPGRYNELDAQWGFERRFLSCDLYRFALNDPTARIYVHPQAHMADEVLPARAPIRLCHTPSRRSAKGTDVIMSVLERLAREHDTLEVELIENVSFAECYARRNTCHILVDQLKLDVGGYGAAAMEAMANGLAVLAYVGHVVPEVERWIPRPPIINVAGDDELAGALVSLVNDRDELHSTRRRSLAWARRYLGPEFTYDYWSRCLSD